MCITSRSPRGATNHDTNGLVRKLTTTTPQATDLGSVLRNHRYNAGLRPKEVAVHVGRSVQTVTGWEKNKRAPSVAQLGQLASLYGVSIGELATADVPPPVRTRAGSARRTT